MSDSNLSVKGRIFDIQRFSTHDGPGVRTIVFLKGCALRCKWCCNPESQSFRIQEMKQGDTYKTVGQDVTVGEVMKTVLKDMPYYKRSGGGLTLSGGESLLQPEFAVALLKAAKDCGLNTAIETTAIADGEVIEKFLPVTDLFLMDIKHFDGEKHKAFTTKSNEKILANAKFIAKNAKKLIIRVPVIPGFNDTKEEIGQICAFTTLLPNVNEIHLLPYHRMGKDKYAGLGRDYPMGDTLPPTAEKMNELIRVAKAFGLKTRLGG